MNQNADDLHVGSSCHSQQSLSRLKPGHLPSTQPKEDPRVGHL